MRNEDAQYAICRFQSWVLESTLLALVRPGSVYYDMKLVLIFLSRVWRTLNM